MTVCVKCNSLHEKTRKKSEKILINLHEQFNSYSFILI